MPEKKPWTPRSRVKNALRQLWLRSRERQAALRRDHYACRKCGLKQSRAKGKEAYVTSHHIYGIDWEALIDLVYERLLVPAEKQVTLCVDCHDALEEEKRNAKKDG